MGNSIVSRAVKILTEEGVKSFFKKASIYTVTKLRFILFPYVLLKLKNLNQNCTLDELLNFAFNGLSGLIRPAQIQSEISELLAVLAKMKPEIVLEIGTANGGTLFLFSRIASEDATIISIDLPSGRFGGGYPRWKIPFYKSFVLKRQKIHLIRADSHKNETLEQIKAILTGRKLDFLFIDGDHTYEGVKKDFEIYSPLVRKGGIIAFHDIVPGSSELVGEVPQFWCKVKGRYISKEIVENWNQGGFGIGILYL